MAYGAFAQAYDLLMQDVDYSAWYAHYRALFAKVGVGDIRRAADICCGTGEFTLRLAREGIKTVGVDISPDMLAVAQEKARRAGVRATFVQMDAAQLALPGRMDAILCGCDGLNYLADTHAPRSFFAAAYAALRAGGALAFDLSTAHKYANMDGNVYGEDAGAACYMLQSTYEAQAQMCAMALTLFVRREGGLYEKYDEEHIQRAHTLQEIEAWLRQAGFGVVQCFSERTFSAPNGEEDRVHVVAVKAGADGTAPSCAKGVQ